MSETEIIVEPGRHDIVLRRVFDAPREVVFKALTDPSLIPSWWGPRSVSTEVDVMEPRHHVAANGIGQGGEDPGEIVRFGLPGLLNHTVDNVPSPALRCQPPD